MVNKKGWLKIYEAVIAVLLIAIVILIVINQKPLETKEDSEIYQIEVSMLREIQLNDSLREDILDVMNLPIYWDEFNSSGLQEVEKKINLKKPEFLDCEANLCNMTDNCLINKSSEEEIYVQSAVISSNLGKYSPRQLKLFCWENEI